MTRYDEFRIRLLEEVATATKLKPYMRVRSRLLANEHGIPQTHVRQELIHLAESGFISLSAWDGERERQHDEWPDADSFFSNATDQGHVRIRLSDKGRELLSSAARLEAHNALD